MFKNIKNWLLFGYPNRLNNCIDEFNNHIDATSNLISKLRNQIDDLNKQISEKIGNFSEKVDSVKGYKVASIYYYHYDDNNCTTTSHDSVNEAAQYHAIDGSNLTKRLKESGGNCVIKNIQFVLVKIQ